MKPIPMLDLKLEYEYMKKDIDDAIARCLEHQRWILGPEVKALEDKIAGYLGVSNCVGISSGTDALVLGLRALALQRIEKEYWARNDKIITTPFTFTATGDAILRSGATPVFVDIDPGTFNIDPEKIEACLSSHQGVVGIIPVHLYGQSCAMDRIMDLARQYNLFVLEDVAQAMGGMYNGRKLGSIGDMGAFSFFPSKNLGGFGDGGMVSTNDQELADLVRMLTKNGGKDKYNVAHIGYNARLDTLQAAVLLAKLKYFTTLLADRKRIARLYSQGLRNEKLVKLPVDDFPDQQSDNSHVYHQYTVRILNGRRPNLQKFLKENTIDSAIYYPVPLHKMPLFQNRCQMAGKLSHAEDACQEVLSLPIGFQLSGQNIHFVCEQIKEWVHLS